MNNTIKWILISLSLIVLVGCSAVLYENLSKNFSAGNIVTEAPVEETEETASMENTEATNDTESPDTQKRAESLAPDFTVFDYEGNKVNLSDYQGKPVVLNFWASWCYYCKVEMPDFNEARALYPDVTFLMINATDGVEETLESAKKYIESNEFELTFLFDTQLDAVMTYGISSFPQTFFIDAEGYLIARGSGMLDLATLERGIEMIR